MPRDTPLRRFHEQHDARFVDFAGYAMPLHYGSIQAEHLHTRAAGSVFDVSHMGRVRFEGAPDATRRLLERLLTRTVGTMAVGQVRYAVVCNASGGTLDDVLVYRFDDHWLLVVNASKRAKLLDHFRAVANEHEPTLDPAADIVDTTDDTAMLAIQGPAVLPRLGGVSRELAGLGRYRFAVKRVVIARMIVSRTGYTGEDGVEIILPKAAVGLGMKALMKQFDAEDPDAGIRPAGLGARDSLRLEAGMPLYGHELDENTDPLSAGLRFAVSLDKDQQPDTPRFIGQDALEALGDRPPRRLVGLRLDGRRTPRQGATVSAGGRAVGVVTSGVMSPSLGHPIALAYLDAGVEASEVDVSIGRDTHPASVGPPKFLPA